MSTPALSTTLPKVEFRGGYVIIDTPADIIECTFLLPAIRAIRAARPAGTVTVLCPESLTPFWMGVSDIHRIVDYPDRASTKVIATILRDQDFPIDSAISFAHSPAAEAFARAEIMQRIGPAARKLERYLTETVSPIEKPGPIQHRVEFYLSVLKEMGIPSHRPEFFAASPLAVTAAKGHIAIAAHSDLGSSYQWGAENFSTLLKHLNTVDSHVFHLFGDVKARVMCDEIAASCPDLEIHNHAGELDLQQTLDFLPKCARLIGVDGSLPHLAARFGVPTTVIFGPNEPAWKRPLGRQHKIVREHVPCSPCFLAKCPLDHRCMTSITPEQVAATLQS